MQKSILFYKFTPLQDPAMVRLWQRTLCDSLGLRGRIIISKHGINGTLGGDLKALKRYITQSKQHAGFKDTVYKWSDGGAADFPKLSVKVRDEIVSFGAADELQVDDSGVVGGGVHLTPQALHAMAADKEVVFFDGRNSYEAAVGRFKGAIVPDTATSKDFIKELDSGKYDAIKDKPVVTYCTGGIRCEILSSLMKNRGFSDVYQLDGGIVTYGKEYGDDGLWEGSLYVFDDRLGVKFSGQAADIADCSACGGKTSRYTNCTVKACNKLVLICDGCKQTRTTCPACA